MPTYQYPTSKALGPADRKLYVPGSIPVAILAIDLDWRKLIPNQNKTNSAVQIIHKPSGVVVKCQATRSQSQNAKIARSLLADKVESQQKGDQSRVAIKAAAAQKKKASKMKKTRRKYRELEGAKEKEVEEEEDEIEIIWDEDVKAEGGTKENVLRVDDDESKPSEPGKSV